MKAHVFQDKQLESPSEPLTQSPEPGPPAMRPRRLAILVTDDATKAQPLHDRGLDLFRRFQHVDVAEALLLQARERTLEELALPFDDALPDVAVRARQGPFDTRLLP